MVDKAKNCSLVTEGWDVNSKIFPINVDILSTFEEYSTYLSIRLMNSCFSIFHDGE